MQQLFCVLNFTGVTVRMCGLQANDQSGVVTRSSGTRATPMASTELYLPGPALNTNGQPRAIPGSAVDPQSIYARVRSIQRTPGAPRYDENCSLSLL